MIINKVVKAVVGNTGYSKKVIRLLLEQYRGEVTITDEVVKAVAGNIGYSKEVMALLFEQHREVTISFITAMVLIIAVTCDQDAVLDFTSL